LDLSTLRNLSAFLVCATVATGLSRGATVTGVLYGETGGNGKYPARAIRLAVRGHVYYLEYAAEYVRRRFPNNTCWEPGAIWTVDIVELRDLSPVSNPECTGRTDKSVHEAFAFVRDYLKSLSDNRNTSLAPNSSDNWKASKPSVNMKTSRRSSTSPITIELVRACK